MLFGIPIAVLLGFLTIILLFTTATFGILVHVYKKPVFKYHKLFAFLTLISAVAHLILAFLLWFYGITL